MMQAISTKPLPRFGALLLYTTGTSLGGWSSPQVRITNDPVYPIDLCLDPTLIKPDYFAHSEVGELVDMVESTSLSNLSIVKDKLKEVIGNNVTQLGVDFANHLGQFFQEIDSGKASIVRYQNGVSELVIEPYGEQPYYPS